MLVVPELLARGRVQRIDVVVRGGDVHDPVDHDGRGFHRLEHLGLYCLFGIGSYTFLPYKIAISGLHKTLKFTMLEPRNGKPIIVDDTCYFIGSNDKQEACLLLELLNSEVAKQFLASNIFIDSKRPVTADVLNRIDLKKVSEQVGRLEELETYLRSGNSDSKGQGLLVFEKSKIYVSKSRKNVNNSPR